MSWPPLCTSYAFASEQIDRPEFPMPVNPSRALRAAGLKAGTAVIRSAPRILEDVQATLANEDIEQVDVLIRVMAGFDRETAEHLEAVGTMAMLLANYAGLPPATVGNCLLGGRVHDIGKLAISRSVLLKPGQPTKAEWTELRLNPVYGSSTLAGLPRLKYLVPFVIAHHERIDGLGYPHGLEGHEIPVESQVIAIADAFCAMTVPRPFCAMRLPHEAIAELEHCAGTQFDADLTEAFANMFWDPGITAV
jgi:HD-GYP domain-containing protein (c-di-GMP phosphodiesterase class II)